MPVFGIRCGPHDFSYAVMDGTPDQPSVSHSERVRYPSRDGPELLDWARREFRDLFEKHRPTAVGYKVAEMTRGGLRAAAKVRLEVEAILQEAAWSAGIRRVDALRKTSMRKRVGYSGHARYVTRAVEKSEDDAVGEFADAPEEMKEAILAGWSVLVEQ